MTGSSLRGRPVVKANRGRVLGRVDIRSTTTTSLRFSCGLASEELSVHPHPPFCDLVPCAQCIEHKETIAVWVVISEAIKRAVRDALIAFMVARTTQAQAEDTKAAPAR
jgi:hypothetical protein